MEYRILGLPTFQEEEPVTTEGEEHTGGAEEHNPVLPEADELIFGSLAFLLVFTLLARFAFPRLREGMEDRRKKIQGDLEKAESARREAESSLQRYEERLQEARGEAGRIIDEARKTAEQMRRDILAKAEDEAQQVVRKAQEEVRGERDRAVQALRRELAEASVDLAARVVGESLDRDRQLRLVEQYIDDVGSMRNGNGNGSRGGG